MKIKGKYQVAKTFELKSVDLALAIVQPLQINDFLFIKVIQKQPFQYLNTLPPGTSVPLFIFDRSILL